MFVAAVTALQLTACAPVQAQIPRNVETARHRVCFGRLHRFAPHSRES
jgi:hypothetical protein